MPMDYVDYIKRLSFRFYQPMMYPKGFTKLSRLLQRCNLSLEVLNTRLPEQARLTRNTLWPLLCMPRLSTFAIGAIINAGVAHMRENACFVNIGVWHGFTFLAGLRANPHKKCIGVDNFSEFDAPRGPLLERFKQYKSPQHLFYEMDYRAYFAEVHQDQIGFYFYDGNHRYEDQLNGLQIAEPFFARNCVILIDDTNRSAPREATLAFLAKSPQTYRIILDQQTCIGDHPTFWNGIMILQKIT